MTQLLKFLFLLSLCFFVGCQTQEAPQNPVTEATTSPPVKMDEPKQASSSSREAYLQRTAEARANRPTPAAADTASLNSGAKSVGSAPGRVVYRGASDSVPQSLLDEPGVIIEVSTERPDEVVVRKP